MGDINAGDIAVVITGLSILALFILVPYCAHVSFKEQEERWAETEREWANINKRLDLMKRGRR